MTNTGLEEQVEVYGEGECAAGSCSGAVACSTHHVHANIEVGCLARRQGVHFTRHYQVADGKDI